MLTLSLPVWVWAYLRAQKAEKFMKNAYTNISDSQELLVSRVTEIMAALDKAKEKP